MVRIDFNDGDLSRDFDVSADVFSLLFHAQHSHTDNVLAHQRRGRIYGRIVCLVIVARFDSPSKCKHVGIQQIGDLQFKTVMEDRRRDMIDDARRTFFSCPDRQQCARPRLRNEGVACNLKTSRAGSRLDLGFDTIRNPAAVRRKR